MLVFPAKAKEILQRTNTLATPPPDEAKKYEGIGTWLLLLPLLPKVMSSLLAEDS